MVACWTYVLSREVTHVHTKNKIHTFIAHAENKIDIFTCLGYISETFPPWVFSTKT